MISAFLRDPMEVGPCNSCGSTLGKILVLMIMPRSRHGMEVRLCVACMEQLKQQAELAYLRGGQDAG